MSLINPTETLRMDWPHSSQGRSTVLEIHGVATLKQTSKKLDATGYLWEDCHSIGIPGGITVQEG